MTDRSRRIFREPVNGNLYLVGEVYYDTGGMSYFTGEKRQRGYYFSVTPTTMSGGTSTVRAFSGTTILISPASRFSKAVLQKVEPSHQQMDQLKAHVRAKNNMEPQDA